MKQVPAGGWVCFHCEEAFHSPDSAREHFGPTPDALPGCILKVNPGGERGLLAALRKAEREIRTLLSHVHDQDSIAMREMRAMQGRHDENIRRAEEAGFQRGLEETRPFVDRAAALYGDLSMSEADCRSQAIALADDVRKWLRANT